ncbi:LPS export ABC transporter permease LptG [Roseinatronobacter sp. NSM]|uniref:LPS export ABC transporter permease LptG n=1 Tax=Roseinatronobacter sp. NSM TaxID=3457785 RepID=UPI004037485D
MTLDLYLIRRLLVAFMMVLGVFVGMLLLLDMVEQMRRFSGQSAGMAQILRLSALNTPEALYEIAPLVLMLSAIWVALAWSRSSEFVIIRAAGRSIPRLIVLPALAFFLFSVVFVAVMNPLVASTTREYSRAQAQLRGDTASAVIISGQDVWLRQADASGQTVIYSPRAEDTGTVLHDATFLIFDAQAGLSLRLRAGRAELQPGLWALHQVKQWRLSDMNPEQQATEMAHVTVPTDLTPEQIRDNFAQVRTVPLMQLPGFIAALERAGFAALEHRMRLNMELALPVLMTGMMLLALGMCIHHARAGGAGIRALITILAGFTLFFLRNFAQVLGETGQVPVMLAAWGPPVATLLLAVGLLLNLEEG